MPKEIETKLARARTKLIMDYPFLGALVLRLPMQAANPHWCPSTATDARSFYYNPDYLQTLNIDQVQFVLTHEALHCALRHFARRQHRHRARWDLACDYAINPLLFKEGLTPPADVKIIESYAGMTAEEIYSTLDENNFDQPMDRHLYDEQSQGTSQPLPLTEIERQQLELQWQQRLAGAAQQALQAGKLSGTLARMLEHLLAPQLPWRLLLARYMTLTAREDYTYLRPSRRESGAIFPSLRSAQLEITVALDISGSISDLEITEFLAEVNALKGQLRARITLLACDVQLAGPWIYEPWEALVSLPTFRGGGGTSFKPVFTYLLKYSPDLLVYFTDANGEFPNRPPPYPVIWLVKGRSKVPWGQRIQLN